MPDPEFDPREAALDHAALAERGCHADNEHEVAANAVHAIVCGLVYAGDQVRALSDVTDEPDRVTLADLREELANIAAAALAAVERPVALQLVLPNAQAVTAWRAMDEPDEEAVVSPIANVLVDALGRIARHEGSGPQDNEIREIARDALRKVGRYG